MSHMDGRDDLLDWAWLDRVYKRDGIGALGLRLRKGAEECGSPVAAIANAVVSPGRYYHLKDGCDLQLDAALKIMRGSWSPAPEGPHWSPNTHSWLAMPPKNRARLIERTDGRFSPDVVTVPLLADLRLVRGVECAIVAHTSGIWACEVSPKGDLIASGSRDASLALWDAGTGVLRTRIYSRWPEVRECAFTPDGRYVVALHQEELGIWDVDTSSLAAVIAPESSLRLDVPGVSPRVAIPVERLGCWDIPCALAFTPDSSSVVLGGWDGVVRTVRLAAFASHSYD